MSILWVHKQSDEPAFSSSVPFEITRAQTVVEPLELLPGSLLSLPAGFALSGKREQYDAESLYEKINGKAPLYLEAGFIALSTQRFVHKEDPSLWFELFVYDMGTALNAFSVYSTQKRTGAQIHPALDPFDHYQTENGLYLRHGRYYIEAIGSSVNDQLVEAMAAVGQQLLRAEAGEGEIAELQLFPLENLVPGSFKLILHNAFGSEGLDKTFLAKYDVNDQLLTAFVSKRESPVQAQEAAEEYYQFLFGSGGTGDSTVDSMQLVDLYGLVEIVFSVGPYVVGIHEGESRIDALEVAGRLRDSILQRISQ